MTANIRRYYWREGEHVWDGYLIGGSLKGSTWISDADAWELCEALANFIDAQEAGQ